MCHVMRNVANAIVFKKMPFAFLVGDLPTYKLIVQLKAGNPMQFEKITPIVGAFHHYMSYIYPILKDSKVQG